MNNTLKTESERVKNLLKDMLPDYLDRQGIQRNREGKFLCINPAHADHSPSMAFYEAKNGSGEIRAHCFSCGANYSLFDAIGIFEGIADFPGQLRRAAEIYGIDLEEPSQAITPTQNRPADPAPKPKTEKKDLWEEFKYYSYNLDEDKPALEYLNNRNISMKTRGLYCIGSHEIQAPSGAYVKAIIIPTSPHSYVARNLDPAADHSERYFGTPGEPRHLFPVDFLRDETKKDLPFIVCEGEFDALAILQSGGNGISMGGIEGRKKLVSFLKDPENQNGRAVINALDNDGPGQKASAALRKDLEEIPGLMVYELNISGKYKDPAERLAKDPDGLRDMIAYCNDIEKNEPQLEKLKFMNANDYIDKFFDDDLRRYASTIVNTGFPVMDQKLNGLHAGLYVLGASSGSGKTTFALQIADNIAKSGKPVLFISAEMSAMELITKSLSRIMAEEGKNAYSSDEIRRNYAPSKNTLNMPSFINKAEIDQALNQYRQTIAPNMNIKEGNFGITIEDITEAVNAFKEQTGKTPVLFVDYLQVIKTRENSSDPRMVTDRVIVGLKLISRDLQAPVICISSFNRGANDKESEYSSFKESSMIEYSSDVLLALEPAILRVKRDLMYEERGNGQKKAEKKKTLEDAEKKDPREMSLTVLKNRYGSKWHKEEKELKNYFSFAYHASRDRFVEKSVK